MTITELIALYRSTANDSATPPFNSDSEILNFINEAEEQACIRANLLFDKTSSFCTISVLASTSVYAIDELVTSIKYATLTDAGGLVYQLGILDHEEQDRLDPTWRTLTQQPSAIILNETSLELNCIPNADYTLKLEVYRMPDTKTAFDSLDIARAHQRRLLDWVLYRAYIKQDGDMFDAEAASRYKKEFEDYFGLHPGVKLRKNQQANTPHRNKGYF